jgi:hypothetical protein
MNNLPRHLSAIPERLPKVSIPVLFRNLIPPAIHMEIGAWISV